MLYTFLKKKKEEEEEGEQVTRSQKEEEDEQNQRKKSKLLGLIPSVASIVTFLLTEDMSSKMVLTDKWTLLMVAMLGVNAILAFVTKNKKQENEEEQKAA